MSEKTKKLYVELEWEKKMTLTEVICIEVPAEVEGTPEEIWDAYRDELLCHKDSFESPDEYANWQCDSWNGEPDLESDTLVKEQRTTRTIKPTWVDWKIPESVEVDEFDPVLAGQKSIFDLMGES